MKIAVIGSRRYGRLEAVGSFVEKLAERHPDAWVISGGAKGVDERAEGTARGCGLRVVSYRPERDETGEWVIAVYVDGYRVCTVACRPHWASFAETAKARNLMVVGDGDKVVAFWDGSSPGTAHALSCAAGSKEVYVYGPDGKRDESLWRQRRRGSLRAVA